MPIIETVTAFIVEETPGNEGIAASHSPNYGWIPLIGGDESNLIVKRTMAQHLANLLGKELKVVRFSVREVIGVVTPETGK